MKKILVFGFSLVSLSMLGACASSQQGFRNYDTFGEAPQAKPAETQLADTGGQASPAETAQQAETPVAQKKVYGGGRAPASQSGIEEDESSPSDTNGKATAKKKHHYVPRKLNDTP